MPRVHSDKKRVNKNYISIFPQWQIREVPNRQAWDGRDKNGRIVSEPAAARYSMWSLKDVPDQKKKRASRY